MRYSALQQAAKLNIERKRKMRRYRVVTMLAALVVFCTTYALILPAITMEQDYYCGMDEHSHVDSCYELIENELLICTCEIISTHTHSKECFDADGILQCTLPQTHEHNENCYSNDGTFICEIDELLPHEHNDECYECTQEEVLVCELTEHTHDERKCTVNPTEETETPEEWEATLPTNLTGQFAPDLLAVANSQLGYKESLTHLEVASDGTLNGYTRYGDWYGSDHGAWNVTFVDFCLHYTNSTAFAGLMASGPDAMCTVWDNAGLYADADEHTAGLGELLFIDMNKDGRADYVGIVSGYEGVSPKVILGDWKDEVAQITLDDSSIILGYGLTNDVPAEGIATEDETNAANNSANLPNTDDALNTPHIVGEMIDDDTNARKLAESGFFTYWEQFLETEEPENSDTDTQDTAAMQNKQPLMMAPFSLRNTVLPSTEQIDYFGGSNVSDDGEVTVSKTIEGTDLENVFDITLTVTSQTNLEIYQKDPDMAIVIVMDISQTMNSAYGSTTRYKAAVESAESFIDKFEENAPENTNAKLGFVAFNTSGHEIFDLQDCTTPAQATALKNEMRQETGAIINQSGYADLHTRFTNVEAGLAMANDMLAEEDANNKFIIFLSDGFPTTYMKTGTTTYEGYDPYCESGTPGVDGVFYDSVFGVHCDYGTSYSDKAAIRAREEADRIKAEGTNIFSIGVDVGGQTIQSYIDSSEGKSFSIVDRTGTTYEIGEPDSQASYENWLRDGIGSGYYYDTTNATQLEAAFQAIFDEIKRIQQENTSEIWTAIDPIPFYGQEGECVEFIHFFTKDGEPANRLIGEYAPGAEDSAVFINEDGHIDWDLKNSGYTSETVTNGNVTTTTYSYEMKYRVRLQNEKQNFIENEIYDTNATTTLTYQLVTTTDGVPEYSEYRKVNFPIPQVHGYLAEFEFDKIDHNRVGMQDVEFVLAHDTERCSVCRGDNTPTQLSDYKQLSDADGHVEFTNIPSGHIYTLTETVPDGYKTNGDTYSVTVAYDVLTLTVIHPDGTSEDITEQGIGKIVNTPTFLPETESLLVQKDLRASDGSTLSDLLLNTMTFTFRVMQTDENGNATDILFLPAGTTFDIVENGQITDSGTIASDGTFTLKHGQIAVFDNLLTEANGDSFVVQELLTDEQVLNYTNISFVAGAVAGVPTQMQTDGYTAFTSSELEIADSQTVLFRNTLDTDTLGELTVTKELGSGGFADGETFRIQVTLGGTPVPVGTEYTVDGETRTVTEEGIIELEADETAVFSGLPGGTRYTVQELIENSTSVGTTQSNVARGKSVIYNSYNNATYADTVLYITDGVKTINGTNFWEGGIGPAYFIIDLGAKYELSHFHVYNYYKDGRSYKYEIAVSLDNNTFTTVATTANLQATTAGSQINISEPVEARYVRVKVTYNSANSYVHCLEFEAWGYSIDESAYGATYTGTVDAGGTVNVNGNGADGTIPDNGTADITVTNKKYPFSVSFPVSKSVTDFSGTATFDFTVEQVQYGTWAHIANQNGVSVTVTDNTASGNTATVVFAAGANGTYYYKVSEVNAGGPFDYDTNFYIVAVTAYGTHAAVTGVYRNGVDEVDVSDIVFTNKATADLLITKTVDAPTVTGEYPFTATVTLNGETVTLPAPSEDAGYTVEGNIIYFTLQNNESLLIPDLPYGASVSVTETLANEVYMPYYRVEGKNTELVYGNTANITLDSTENTVHFVNKAYYELPETGGSGTWMYTMGGLLMTAAAIFLLYKRKRYRKGENALS